jgi:hypothetical protein
MKNKKTELSIISSLNRLNKMFPNNKEYIKALKNYKKL